VEGPFIVLGLGNPGTRYRETRHNLGFRVVDSLAARWGAPLALRRELQSWVAEVERPGGPLLLAKPRTYMNRSGRAARALCEHFGIEPSRLLVIYDDADLDLGRLRLRPAGGRGGHRGLGSTIDALATERIPRLRLGVRGAGRGDEPLADYVLTPFDPEERPIASELVERAADVVEAVLEHGLEAAMNAHNRRDASPAPGEEGAGGSE
jgi:PTH1 family peptidyl-tRNA hydrolase